METATGGNSSVVALALPKLEQDAKTPDPIAPRSWRVGARCAQTVGGSPFARKLVDNATNEMEEWELRTHIITTYFTTQSIWEGLGPFSWTEMSTKLFTISFRLTLLV